MKVPTLPLYSRFMVIDKDGKEYEMPDELIFGCSNMCYHLEKNFGIKTSTSTVYNGKKKFIPNSYPYGRTKEYYLAYFNWCINFKKEERAHFFEDEFNIEKFSKNNPIVDLQIIVKKTP